MALAEHYFAEGPNYPAAGVDPYGLLARPAWMADALCREHPGISWFPEVGQSPAPAKAICARCTVATECGAYARQNGETTGVWAGVNLGGRGPSARPRRRIVSDGAPARLRVTPKPEPVLPKPPPPRRVPKPKPPRAATAPSDDDQSARFQPASCARCPMAVKKGKTLCKGCERAAG